MRGHEGTMADIVPEAEWTIGDFGGHWGHDYLALSDNGESGQLIRVTGHDPAVPKARLVLEISAILFFAHVSLWDQISVFCQFLSQLCQQ